MIQNIDIKENRNHKITSRFKLTGNELRCQWLSKKGRRVDALALRAEEGRDKLR